MTMDTTDAGQSMIRLITELFPICRSITGEGVRQTLDLLKERIPLTIQHVPSGTPVLDWVVPNEWNIRDAWVKNSRGEKVIDFKQNNLHIVSYSVPIHSRMTLNELRDHLFSLPDYPDWIPYRTSYYHETWGFCLSHQDFLKFQEDTYEVLIDSTLQPGEFTYGELILPGENPSEVLISTHICHPSLMNDNLSGIALCTSLAESLLKQKHRLTYRFLFIPGTIGSITWLARNEKSITNIQAGLVAACLGDPGAMHYKQSRQGNALIDRAVEHVLKHTKMPYEIEAFSPYGYDERQYCSPGFNLPVGSLTRTPYGRYPQYHTSADNLELASPAALADSLLRYLEVIDVLEGNLTYVNTHPKAEPQLGRRGLYSTFGGRKDSKPLEMALLWVLNYSDGSHDLLDIADRAGMPFALIREAADALLAHDLLVKREI